MISIPAFSLFRAPLPSAGAPPHRRGDLCTARAVTRRRQGGAEDPDPSDDDGTLANLSRRDFMMRSVLFAALGTQADSLNTADGRTVINSILGAYGLPQLAGVAKGFKQFDDFDAEYTFIYPSGWVRRKNTLREGVYIADFNTADKLSVESFSLASDLNSAASATETDLLNSPEFVQSVIDHLLNPGKEVGGDSRIELPRANTIKTEVKTQEDGKPYLYLAFPSSTTTRSGYDVRRKNVAVAGIKRGTVYALGVSVRSDQWNEAKAEAVAAVVESFRVRGSSGGSGGGAAGQVAT